MRAQAFAIVLLGSVIAPLDSAVNAAFPAISAAFGLEVASIRWVVISYLVAFSSCIIVSGRLGDLFGYRRVFGIGLLVSAAALLACAMAPGYGWLMAARAVQGVGIALVVGVAPALALSLYPESQRTRVLAHFGTAFGVALAAGPAVGGVLVDAFGWQAVYFARLPLALGAWLLLTRVPAVAQQAGRTFDLAGSLLLAAWTGSLLLAITLFGAAALGCGVLAALVFVVFLRRESGLAQPIIRPALFRSAAFSVPNLAASMVHFAGFAIFLLGPYFFVRELGLTAQGAGILLALGPAGAAAGSALAGRVAIRFGARPVAFAGMLLDFAGVAVASTWDGSASLAAVAASLAIQGMGIGLFHVAYTDIVIAALPAEERGVASSLTNFTRTLGVVACVALGSALFSAAEARGEAFLGAYQSTFGAMAAGAAGFLLLTLLRPRVWFPVR